MRSSRKLKSIYRTFNHKWFNDQLPDDAVVRWATPEEMRNPKVMKKLDGCYYNQELTHNGRALILLNPELKRRKAWLAMTLLHECNHIYTDDERGDHGAGFNAGMKRLANMGAFDGYW